MRDALTAGISPRSATWAALAERLAGRAVAYLCHEGTGTDIIDQLGQGPDITIAGTLTSLWDNPGRLTPNGTDILGTETGPDAVIDEICDMGGLEIGQLLIGFDLYVTGNPSSAETVLCWGENSASSGWEIGINGSGQINLAIRGVGAGGTWSATNLTGHQVSDLASVRVSYVLDIHGIGGQACDVDLYAQGAPIGNSITGKSLLGGAVSPPSGGDDRGLTLMARATSTATDRLLASATSGAQIGRLLMVRRPLYDAINDSTLALELALDLYRYPGEAPRSLLAA